MMRIKRRVIEKLTQEEIEFLSQFTNGYGRTQYACTLSKVPFGSMRKILTNGSGLMTNIEKLRSTILKDLNGAKVENITNNANVAA